MRLHRPNWYFSKVIVRINRQMHAVLVLTVCADACKSAPRLGNRRGGSRIQAKGFQYKSTNYIELSVSAVVFVASQQSLALWTRARLQALFDNYSVPTASRADFASVNST
jgi:hypothetical protein